MTPAQPYTIQIVEWSQQHDALAKLRTDVFVEEQNVPVEIIMDDLDAAGVHVAARDTAGNLIGTGRMILHPSVPRIGRMAVMKSWRSTGVGGQILVEIVVGRASYDALTRALATLKQSAPARRAHGRDAGI